MHAVPLNFAASRCKMLNMAGILYLDAWNYICIELHLASRSVPAIYKIHISYASINQKKHSKKHINSISMRLEISTDALCSQIPSKVTGKSAVLTMVFCAFGCAARRLGGASLGMGACAPALALAKGRSKGCSRTRPEQPTAWGSVCTRKRLAGLGPAALQRTR